MLSGLLLHCRAANQTANQEVMQKAEELKNMGNHAFFSRDLPKAVGYYSQALQLNPTSPMLHTNRCLLLDAVIVPLLRLKLCQGTVPQIITNMRGTYGWAVCVVAHGHPSLSEMACSDGQLVCRQSQQNLTLPFAAGTGGCSSGLQ